MKIARAYVAKKSEIEKMMQAAKLPRHHVKCGEVAGEHISDPKWTMRKGELLGVFDLTAFGDKRGPMADGVARIQAMGADVCEVETGAIAGQGVAMLQRALQRIHRESRKFTSGRVSEMNKERHAERRKDWLPEKEARIIWGSPAQYTETAALLAMKGWPRSTAYATFGKRKDLEAKLVEEMKAARKSKRKAK
jgi:hypothetical protein